MRPKKILPFALAVAILAVSTASLLIRLAQENAPSFTIGALRLGFATALLTPIALFRYGSELRSLRRGQVLLAAISGAFLAAHFAAWITSLEFTTVASSVVLVSTGPIWVAVASPLFLREGLGRAAVVGLALAVIGGIIISLADTCAWNAGLRCALPAVSQESRPLWGNFLALAGAWAVTGYLILGRHLRSSLSLVPYVFLVYGFAAMGLLAAAFVSGRLVLTLPPLTYVWIVLLAVVPQLIGHSTYNWALRYLRAQAVAVTTLGEPVGSAVLAYLVLGETPGSLVLVGAVLILAGIYMSARIGDARDAIAPSQAGI